MRTIDVFGNVSVEEKIVLSLPYMGSKRKLANKILNAIYKKIGDFEKVYDVFGGGAAFSVAALLAGHKVHYNEKDKSICELLRHIAYGNYLPNRWVGREEFKEKVSGDDWFAGFLKCCWSFGNNGRDYLYGKKLEEYKKVVHKVVIERDESLMESLSEIVGFKLDMPESMSDLKNKIKNAGGRLDLEHFERFGTIKKLESIERLQSIESFESVEQLKESVIKELSITNLDYIELKTDEDSIIYCDPPYIGTQKYNSGDFDSEKFWNWCRENKSPIFISEYTAPSDFYVVAEFNHRSTLSATNNSKVTVEKLFWNGKTHNKNGAKK